MQPKPNDTFFGVYNRSGELEAVEGTLGLALAAAAELSPGSASNRRVTRIVRQVLVTPLDSKLSTPVALKGRVENDPGEQETGTGT